MYWNDLEDLTFIESIWADAKDIDPATLHSLFLASNELCVAYAPELGVADPIPERYLLAEIFQARHIWSQARGGNRQEYSDEGLSIPVYPLVFVARDLLRPKRNPLSRLR